MPPSSNILSAPLLGSPSHFFQPQNILAQVPPRSPSVSSSNQTAGFEKSSRAAPAPTGSSINQPPRLTWPDLVAMRNEWNRIFTQPSGQILSFEQKILGANYAQWRAAQNSTYQNVSMTLLRAQDYLQGREIDTFSLRSALLELFRTSRNSFDPILRNTPISLIDHLSLFQEPHYQEKAQRILSLMEEAHRLAQPSNPGGSYVPAFYFSESLRRRGVDPSWFIPTETLASPETLKAAMIYQGEGEDGVVHIPILTQTSRGPATIGWREVDVTGRIIDFYAPRNPLQQGQIIRRSLLPSQSSRLLIAAAFGAEELPSAQRVFGTQERRVASLIRSGWIRAELTDLDQELTQWKTRLTALQTPSAPHSAELTQINERVAAIQSRATELNELIPASSGH